MVQTSSFRDWSQKARPSGRASCTRCREMKGRRRLVRWGVSALMLLVLPECNCPPCDDTLELGLPSIAAGTEGDIVLEFRHGARGPLEFQCVATLLSGASRGWSCRTRDGRVSSGSAYVDLPGVGSARLWHLRVFHDRSVRELEAQSYADGPSEAWPHQCVCDWFHMDLGNSDLGLPSPRPVTPGSGGAPSSGGAPGTGGMGGAMFGGAPQVAGAAPAEGGENP